MYNIANGLSVMHSFTIVEGQNIFDITDQLAADETVILDKNLDKLPNVVCGYQLDTYEGMLMADTYQFRDKIKSSDLIHNANKLLCEYLEQAWTTRDRSIPYKII